MGKIFLRLLAVVLFLALIVIGVGYVLPRDFEIATSIEIDAPPENVFAMINELPNWQHWSTWNEEKIEGLKIQYSEKKKGTGAVQTWNDPRASGKLWITESQPHERLKYNLKFGDFPEMKSQIDLVPSGGGTLVKWSSNGHLPDGPFYGYTALLFPAQMTHEYDLSLSRLKAVLE